MIRRIIVPIAVLLAGFAAVLFSTGEARLVLFIDIPSFILVPVLAVLYTAGSYGFKGIGRAYRAACSGDASREDMEYGAAVFRDMGRNFWIFAILTFGISLMVILANLTSPETLGPNLAVAILTALYAAFFNLLLVQPFLSTIKHRLNQPR
ncbi:hypothetical protein [Breznakiella homolactica]|uniref:Uncharacterized protein n=1 Tax=Breznakiella homolactica TaxID=2798577 RepID=A0A7T7XNH3_9SPIR|nr:hypothetical protein [Breznakiella homolactica]QQO09600.1 hypothetical protein JFL75_01390 [Breznakiella homolactica]